MIKRILVGLGGTSITPVAVRQAVELAARHEAELTGVTIVNLDHPAFVSDEPPESGILVQSQLTQFRDMQEHIEQAVAEFHATAEAAGVSRRQVIRETAEPFSKMIDLARFHDLTVCGLKKLLKYEFAPGGKPLDM